MINNDIANQLNRYFNRGAKGETTNVAEMMMKRLKARQEAMNGGAAGEEQAKADAVAQQTSPGKMILRNAAKDKADKNNSVNADDKKNNDKNKGQNAAAAEEEELSPMERREKELKAIMDKLNAEEAQRYPNRYNSKGEKPNGNKGNNGNNGNSGKTDAAPGDANVVNSDQKGGLDIEGSGGIEGFLNDMPLFNEFKTSLMDAFKRLDSASMGSISAQYELNYTTMQYVANDAGGYDYTEQAVNVKLDLNYIKAAAGGQSGKEIADAIGKSEDFASLVENLQNINDKQNAQAGGKVPSPEDFLSSMQDYFSPEKTAERIVDFSSAFFGNSAAFKKYGDTEEGRSEFAKTMRDAIQKGFDQAMGTLGKVPKSVQDGIDKTHELTFKGIDDFVKNGLNRNKQDQGVYDSLEQFGFSFEMSYSSRTVSVSGSAANNSNNNNGGDRINNNGNGNNNGNYGNHYGNYANNGNNGNHYGQQKPNNTSAALPGVDAQA